MTAAVPFTTTGVSASGIDHLRLVVVFGILTFDMRRVLDLLRAHIT